MGSEYETGMYARRDRVGPVLSAGLPDPLHRYRIPCGCLYQGAIKLIGTCPRHTLYVIEELP